MEIISSIGELQAKLTSLRCEGTTLGLVPTMGALHEGHISLVERSLKENACTVVSIFVNPTQFNNPTDLATYPRTLSADVEKLNALSADIIVFTPKVEEIYPRPDKREFSYPPTDSVMEGARRPGHFNGVCQIVSKLFGYTFPTRAYFGEKDFQQIAVVRAMVRELGFPLEIVACPIVRESTGLALSSRNTLLTPSEREKAATIYATLLESREFAKNHSVDETTRFVVDRINVADELEVEYFQIADAMTLQPISQWSDAPAAVGCITVYCGSKPVRLIDNIKY